MLSSAELIKQEDRYYLFYEGIRGAGPGAAGDSQFGLGLARTTHGNIDGPWEKYPDNPILLDSPANIGVGHADLVIDQGISFLYTSLDGRQRSRLRLAWNLKRPEKSGQDSMLIFRMNADSSGSTFTDTFGKYIRMIAKGDMD